MSAPRVIQHFHFHDGAHLLQVDQAKDCAWLTLNSFVHPAHVEAGPQVTVYFDRGVAGRMQIMALIDALTLVAVRLLEDREAQDHVAPAAR